MHECYQGGLSLECHDSTITPAYNSTKGVCCLLDVRIEELIIQTLFEAPFIHILIWYAFHNAGTAA